MAAPNFTGNKSYEKLLKGAKTLFWKHGIKRVTVEEICKASSVSKMTFYRFFSNKIDCAIKVFDTHIEKSMVQYHETMNDSTIDFSEKIKRIILQKLESTDQISHEILEDMYTHPQPEIQAYFKEKKEESLNFTMNMLSDAQKNGWIRRDVKPEFMMYYLNKSQEFISDPKLEEAYENTQDLVMEITRFFFYGVGVQEKK